jgi:hypothetical protein
LINDLSLCSRDSLVGPGCGHSVCSEPLDKCGIKLEELPKKDLVPHSYRALALALTVFWNVFGYLIPVAPLVDLIDRLLARLHFHALAPKGTIEVKEWPELGPGKADLRIYFCTSKLSIIYCRE